MCRLQNYFETGVRGRDVHVHTMNAYVESRDTNPLIHNIVIRCGSLVGLKLWPLYCHSNSHLCELINRLRRKKFLTPARKPNFNHPAHSAVTVLTVMTADPLIAFSLVGTLNKTKLYYTSKNETS